jgi:hypothetical protein
MSRAADRTFLPEHAVEGHLTATGGGLVRSDQPATEAGYETFVRDPREMHPDRDLALVLRELAPGRRKYLAQNVIARVVCADTRPPGFAPLRMRTAVGNVVPGPWWVRVQTVLPARLPGAPYTSVFDALDAFPRD